MQINIVSFGYKHGMPSGTTFTVDCRVIKNPAQDIFLRTFRGTDKEVKKAIKENPRYEPLYDYLVNTTYSFLKEERKAILIGIGCHSGHHRSVAIAEELAKDLKKHCLVGLYTISVKHRDIDKE